MTGAGSTAGAAGAGRPVDVFISYSSRDLAAAERLQRLLETAGLRVWRDKTELEAGDPFVVSINRALDEAARVIVLWSERSVQSEWVLGEAAKAQSAKKIMPVALDGCPLPAPFNILHTLRLEAVVERSELITRALGALRAAGGSLFIPTKPPRIDVSRMPTTFATRLFGREAEMALLNHAWDSAADAGEKCNVLVLDAMGGTGKTALINHFVHGLSAQGWRGAEAVFVWSFYSQGTDDKRQASADAFFSAALAWFGYTGAMPPSQHDKGVRLAELIKAQRVLLVLDGVEPLQYGPARRAGGAGDAGITGGLKDHGMRALLRQLAADNQGLVLVTTRLRVPDLNGNPEPAVVTRRLGPIPTGDGVELVRVAGVKGPYAELKELVDDLNGHAIALNQVATWLVSFRDGDVRCRDELPSLVDLGGDNERDPFRVMLAYETQFKRQIEEQVARGQKPQAITAARQLALLFLMGLFDRPMEKGDREALLKGQPIAGLTEVLAGRTPGQIDYDVHSLRDLGLLLPKDAVTPDDLDAHPLVREYFGLRLEQEQPEAWKAAHSRLYDYYRFRGLPEPFREPVAYALVADEATSPDFGARKTVTTMLQGGGHNVTEENTPIALMTATPDQLREAAKLIDGPDWKAALKAFLPDDEEGMAPLFTAIAHGCAAGLIKNTWGEVYISRISRGNINYATRRLGLFGGDLNALANFFVEPFAVPSPELSPRRRALVLNRAGFRLRALGRLAEAVPPIRAGMEASVETEDWKGASADAQNLSELLVALGRLLDGASPGDAGALTVAQEAITHGDRSLDTFMRLASRTTFADAALHAGEWSLAEERFAEAEKIERMLNAEFPLFGSLRSYQLCTLRLAQGRSAEVAARGGYALNISRHGTHDLLGIALGTLAQGRAAHQAAAKAAGRGIGKATGEGAGPLLDAAVDALREAGSLHHLPRGLLARAAYHRDAGNHLLAAQDVQEAFEISERGGMRLFLTDCWLESARQRLARPDPGADGREAAARALSKASDLIEATGYRRCLPDRALVAAELMLALGRTVEGRAAIGHLITLMRSHNLWGFLAEIEHLASRYGLADAATPEGAALAATIAGLHEARARYDAEADVAFEKARKVHREDGLDDDYIDGRLADPVFRRALNRALVGSGYKPLDETPVEEQRNDARTFIKGLREQAAKEQDLTDQVLDIRLDDPVFRRALAAAMESSQMPGLDSISHQEQRQYARKYIEQVERDPDRQRSEEGAGAEAAAIPDEVVEHMLADPKFREMLNEFHVQAGLPKLEALGDRDQRIAARALIAAIAKAKTE